ncbi:MAG TPA: hypothetical protein VJN43_00305 [Bryobacteraceae bacterium]|nr:hypothetical protein [Bryobacteraceae bacterium]
MARLAVVGLFILFAALGICQAPESKPMNEPALPFYDWKACPFEGCAYREWKARKTIVVYDTWKESRKPVAHLSPGDSVLGLTGVVITFKPGVIRMDRDLPDQDLKRGETLLTYTYRGEGVSAVWFKGRYYDDFDISFARWPDGQGCGGAHCAATYVDLGRKIWWAEVKPGAGRTGWVNMNEAEFDGVDLLAELDFFARSKQNL